MRLPECPNCKHQFRWTPIFKKLWKLNQDIKCPNCETRLYPSIKFRNRISYLSLICLIVSFGLLIFNIPNPAYISLILILWGCFILTMPYLYIIDNEDKPLW